ncbi:MAG: class I SAM-dependent methyltransferase [Spirochaetota bacterium]|nr:class I SAM-dependent methyltransferase [Spirochaetota bacterium]
MHKESKLKMQWFKDNFIENNNIKILDVGSYDVNGSYRDIFKESEYHGLDIEKGENVDIVLQNPYDWSSIQSNYYDVVISGQALEHVEFFWITMKEMCRVLKKGGLICIIVPNNFKEHRYPVDCYRFFTDGLVALAKLYKLNILHCSMNQGEKKWINHLAKDAILIAKKTYSGIEEIVIKDYKLIELNHNELCRPFKYKKQNNNFIIRNIRRVLRIIIKLIDY